jgi:hypothetical protein
LILFLRSRLAAYPQEDGCHRLQQNYNQRRSGSTQPYDGELNRDCSPVPLTAVARRQRSKEYIPALPFQHRHRPAYLHQHSSITLIVLCSQAANPSFTRSSDGRCQRSKRFRPRYSNQAELSIASLLLSDESKAPETTSHEGACCSGSMHGATTPRGTRFVLESTQFLRDCRDTLSSHAGTFSFSFS